MRKKPGTAKREIIATPLRTESMSPELSILRVVAAAILEGDRCLAAQRGPSAIREALKWEFPGGKIEAGELPHDALRREIREELRVGIEIDDWLGHGHHSGSGPTIELDIYTARIVHGQVHLVEHCRFGWFRASEIASLEWATADQSVLPTLIDLLVSRSTS